MAIERNAGLEEDEVLQNRFTAYLLSAVQRRKALYIDAQMKNQRVSMLIEDTVTDSTFDLDREALQAIPLYMRLQNEKLYLSLSQLTERERYVFFNRALDEKSLDVLAAELGLSYKGVAAIYYRTIEKIRKKMKGESK